jgi:hypothetical protein
LQSSTSAGKNGAVDNPRDLASFTPNHHATTTEERSMTGSDIEARIGIERQKARDAEARAKSLEVQGASRNARGRFARAVIRPAKHLGLIEALHPRIVPTDEQTN